MNPTIDTSPLLEGPAMLVRADRGLFELSGKDRTTWLHNLTTNQVQTLQVGDGNYAFVLNVQGRIQFDINLLVRADSIWIDLDRRYTESAGKHFAKYTITEQVSLIDRTADFARVGLIGRSAGELLAALGADNATVMASLSHRTVRWNGVEIPLIRHDFCGPLGFELLVPSAVATDFKKALSDGGLGSPVVEASPEAVEASRIEWGIPWPGNEITDEYLPAETRQLERAVSYQKGCYLGQEVVERMRSRHVVARQFVGIRINADRPPICPQPIAAPDGSPAGTLTSACHSQRLGMTIGLGYVKTTHSSPGAALSIGAPANLQEGQVTPLPFARAESG